MTVHTWHTSERTACLPIGRPTQSAGNRGHYSKCYAVDVEQTGQYLFVTVAAGSMKGCIAEFRHMAASLGIPAEKWEKFDIPLTDTAVRVVQSWAEEVRRTIAEHRGQAAADSSGTF